MAVKSRIQSNAIFCFLMREVCEGGSQQMQYNLLLFVYTAKKEVTPK